VTRVCCLRRRWCAGNACCGAWNAHSSTAACVGACSQRHTSSECPAPARVSLACLCMRADFDRPANRVINHKALFVCVSGPCFVCALVYFCSRGDMSVGTNKRHPVSSRPCRGFLHAHTRTHWDKSSFLHACMLACYPACCCHLLPPPATSAAAACFAKTRPEVARVRRPSWGEILGNQTLAWLVALWSTNPPRFTRGINPLE